MYEVYTEICEKKINISLKKENRIKKNNLRKKHLNKNLSKFSKMSFYKFRDTEQQEYHWEKILQSVRLVGDCVVWIGKLHEGITPQYKPGSTE